ncbi:MAG: AAA family ATPase [Pseudomonas sp.]|nr:AAA family ATPase [Pseudomonas sp.]
MKFIDVLNKKGVAVKTTIATHLALALQLCGADVLLFDSDPQGSGRDCVVVCDKTIDELE